MAFDDAPEDARQPADRLRWIAVPAQRGRPRPEGQRAAGAARCVPSAPRASMKPFASPARSAARPARPAFSPGASIDAGPLAFRSRQAPCAQRPGADDDPDRGRRNTAGSTCIPSIRATRRVSPITRGRRRPDLPSSAGFHTARSSTPTTTASISSPRGICIRSGRWRQGRARSDGVLTSTRAASASSRTAAAHPGEPAHIEMHNPWCVNRPARRSSSPSPTSRSIICGPLLPGAKRRCIVDDVNKNPIPGMDRFGDLVDLKNPIR